MTQMVDCYLGVWCSAVLRLLFATELRIIRTIDRQWITTDILSVDGCTVTGCGQVNKLPVASNTFIFTAK